MRAFWTSNLIVAGLAPGPATVHTAPGSGEDRAGTSTADVLDVRVLEELADDLGDLAARRLAKQFGDTLGQRLSGLATAVADRSAWATFDTAANLAAASSLVGAVPLAWAAWAVTQDVVRRRTLPTTETLQRLERLAHDTEAALARYRAGGRRRSAAWHRPAVGGQPPR
jgi:hypothetical protein